MRTATSTTQRAVEGVLGPRPQRFLAPDAELAVAGTVVCGAEPVAEAIRELTAAADMIRIDVDGRHATAVWPMAAKGGDTWVVFRLEVDGGVVRSVRAEPRR